MNHYHIESTVPSAAAFPNGTKTQPYATQNKFEYDHSLIPPQNPDEVMYET